MRMLFCSLASFSRLGSRLVRKNTTKVRQSAVRIITPRRLRTKSGIRELLRRLRPAEGAGGALGETERGRRAMRRGVEGGEAPLRTSGAALRLRATRGGGDARRSGAGRRPSPRR